MTPAQRQQIFVDKYFENKGKKGETVSGSGSTLAKTIHLRKSFAFLLEKLGITSLLDVGCCDLNWIRKVDLKGIRYVGIDIVPELVEANIEAFGAGGKRFVCADMVETKPAQYDLILCKDVLSHLSNRDAIRALNHFKASGSRFLLANILHSAGNEDITTGRWRHIDLTRPPFGWGAPLLLLPGNEPETQIGLWDLHEQPLIPEEEEFSLAYFAEKLSARGEVFFVQIGALDGVNFDPIHPFVTRYGWRGLLVEPLADVFQKLLKNYQGRAGLAFENAAIAETEGTCWLNRVPLEKIVELGLPNWAFGISSLYKDKNLLSSPEIAPHIVRERVPCMTLPQLLEKHGIERIDLLQIDTEGADFMILKQLDFTRYRPSVIHLEFGNLTRIEMDECRALLVREGYRFRVIDMDLLAVSEKW